ncbi:glycosyltransferase [Rufibacter quisquiliarum]|uniref:Glycosyltransferase involved in cell wall biosynthesis n=1 Tax=Rufibacter quisquiliarum TaxID=1549639 RepID=A0A839GPL3_9BACT|nr:glycosyltransferase [Rufibacter quisquiliarum]MBA9078729.1 glycosyltransferase involved in cell wall biosynthesis [Rufibacter quisquiliarum]
MFRKRILLASLLKPVSDTRMYGKIGKSLAKMAGTEIHVAGFVSKNFNPTEPGIQVHPVFNFSRLSWQRVAAQFTYWRLLKNIKPQLVIVGTHELLLPSWWYCRLHSCKLVYDVRENYYVNLTTQGVYPVAGKLLGLLVRAIEKVTAPAVHHFLLAEASYAHELPFIGTSYTVLQNKYQPLPLQVQVGRKTSVHLAAASPLRLLFSGTISQLYGVLEAVRFVEQLRHYVPDAQLTIIGYCADQTFLGELKKKISPLPFVQLIGGEALVPHAQILEEEKRHHVGLLPYHPHPSTFHCVPTKLFEYLGNGLVTVAQYNPHWNQMIEAADAGFGYDFSKSVTRQTVQLLLEKTFYQNGLPAQVFWANEEPRLERLMRQLL